MSKIGIVGNGVRNTMLLVAEAKGNEITDEQLNELAVRAKCTVEQIEVVPEEDFVFYESEEDFIRKIDYYLSHEKERQQIAANALGKMAERHTFCHRVTSILQILSD